MKKHDSRILQVALCILLGLAFAPSVQAEEPSARSGLRAPERTEVIGPMVGAVTQKSARIWAQLSKVPRREAALVWLEYRLKTQSSSRMQVSARVATGPADHWTAQWLLDGLEPGQDYEYRVKWQSRTAKGESGKLDLKTEGHWQYRTDPPAIRLLAGSCAYTNDLVADRPGAPYGRSTEIFKSMAERKPDLTLWMGDNIYLREPDFHDETAMSQRYDHWRSLPDLQPLLRQGSHLATWDDHDYGPNDSNASYVHKEKSLKIFQRYWANPGYGLQGLPGVFTQHTASDVDVFMLDDRWYRDSDKLLDDDRHMLGPEQVRWLKNALLASTATWKFVVSGSQVLNLNNRFEGWNRFESESRNFLNWLERQKIPGVIFLSGDRHFSTLLKLGRATSYPLYEMTCSPLTAGTYDNPLEDLKENTRIVSGTVVTKNNFCELEISGARNDRHLSMTIRDVNGAAQWTHTLHESELR
jgi:alkaline phosphatase D